MTDRESNLRAGFLHDKKGRIISHRATGWYFSETIHGVEPLLDPEDTPLLPSREELIRMVEEGAAYCALRDTVDRSGL